MKQADFYILPCTDDDAKLNFLGKLLSRIVAAGHSIYVYCDDQFSTHKISEALWLYKDISFLANATPEQPMMAPISLGWDKSHLPKNLDVLVNFSNTIPPNAADFTRVVEIVIQQTEVLARSRERYKSYQAQGFTIKNHDMRKPAANR
jgi:DNA polymerase-3 subunit chi